MDNIDVVNLIANLGSTGVLLFVFMKLREDVKFYVNRLMDIIDACLDDEKKDITEAAREAIDRR